MMVNRIVSICQKMLINIQIFFGIFVSTVLSSKECGGKFCPRSRNVVLYGRTFKMFPFCHDPAILPLGISFMFYET